MNDCALQMFGLRAKLAMAQECFVDGTFDDARYYDVCRKHLRQHIPGVDIPGLRSLRQEVLLLEESFSDALELVAQELQATPSLASESALQKVVVGNARCLQISFAH